MDHRRGVTIIVVVAIGLIALGYLYRPGRSSPADQAVSSVAAASASTLTAPVTPSAGPVPAGSQWPAYDATYEWPLTELRASQLWSRSHKGAGLTVAVVDTGVDATHPDLAGAVAKVIDLTDPRVPGDTSRDSHGTEIAGLIAGRGSPGSPAILPGLAPAARLIDVRVTDDERQVTAAEIAVGINAAVGAGAQIINVALATAHDAKDLDAAVASAVRRNRLVVASESRGGTKAQYPADSPGSLAVAGTDRSTRPTGSLVGHGPRAVYAPGADLYSTVKHAGYRSGLGGNDYATAYVSAAAALLWAADPGLGAAKVADALISSVTQKGAAPDDFGSIDPLASMAAHGYPVGSPPATTTATPPAQAVPAAPASSRAATRPPVAEPPGILTPVERALLFVLAGLLLAFVGLWALFGRGGGGPRGRSGGDMPLDLDLEPL